ncbi:unnamed protein product, partial [Dibothriocephalus latus]
MSAIACFNSSKEYSKSSESYCNLFEGSIGVSSLVEMNGMSSTGATGGLTDGDSGCFQNGDMSLSGVMPTMALDSVTGEADHRFSELFMPRAIAPCASLESLYTSTSISSTTASTMPSPLETSVPAPLPSTATAPTSTSVTAIGNTSASTGLVFMNGRLGADPLG